MNLLILGAGKAGVCLARLFAKRGIKVSLWNRWKLDDTHRAALHRSNVALVEEIPPQSNGIDLVVMAVADNAIDEVAKIASGWGMPHDLPFVHCSGGREAKPDSDGSTAAAIDSRPTGMMHPAFSFSGPDLPMATLEQVCFLVDGDEPAVRRVSAMLESAELDFVSVSGVNHGLYHAGCVTASNFLGLIGSVAGRFFDAAGLQPDTKRALLLSLMRSVLDNAAEHGFLRATTGPVARGEVATVLREAAEIAKAEPDFFDLYLEGNLAIARVLDKPDTAAEILDWLDAEDE